MSAPRKFPQPLPPSLAADLEEFEDWMVGRNFSAQTVEKRMAVIHLAMREWQTWEVRPSTIVGYLRRHAGWTASTYFSHFRAAFDWAQQTGRTTTNPMTDLKAPATPDPTPQPLSPEELNKALETAQGHMRAWLLLAYLAGLRCHEVAKLRGEDITAETLTVIGKGSRLVRLPTHPDLWDLAQSYPRSGWWFPSRKAKGQHLTTNTVSVAVSRHLRTVGVTHGSIHRVRASYGTELLRSGANIRVVQDLMRHRSLATTEHYLGVATDDRRDAIRGLSIA